MSELMQVIIFYLSITVLGMAAHVFTKTIYKDYSDKGYAFSKTIGMLIVGYISWILKFFFKIEIASPLILIILGILVIAPLIKVVKSRIKINKNIVLTETIFLVAFLSMLLFRGAVPKIEGIEKFMDYAIINSLHRETTIPPTDVWFSGNSINYYYFGHYIISTVFKLSSVNPSVGYNLTVALIFASAATQTYALVLFLTKKHAFALVGALLLVAGNNLDYLHNLVFNPTHTYFYADARSLILHTINEFPAYSFLISDLHAHIIDIPFVLLLISLIFALLKFKELLKSKIFLTLLVLTFGSLFAINSWDMFIYAAILFFGMLYCNYSLGIKPFKALVSMGLVFLCSIIMFLPMYLYFKPAVGGIGFFKFTLDTSAIVRMFGFFIFSFEIFMISTIKSFKSTTLVTKVVFGLILYGLLLVIIPEFAFIKDIYFKLNPPYFRANTIFKIWYQAWIIFSVATPYAIYITLSNIRFKALKVIYIIPIFVLVFFVFGSTIHAVKYIVGPKYEFKGLDGTSYLNSLDPDARKMIEWINMNIHGSPILLETFGDSYTTDSLISSYTGLPTLVGWSSHELGWRDNWPEIAARMGDIEKMYKNSAETKQLVSKYNVQYILIGPDELEKYGETVGVSLSSMSKEIVSFGDYRLLKVIQ